MLYIYIVIWFEHHGNRLYGFMGLRSKMLEWMDGKPLSETVTTTRAPVVLKNVGSESESANFLFALIFPAHIMILLERKEKLIFHPGQKMNTRRAL